MWNTDPARESGLGSDSDTMAELAALLTTDIPECRNQLLDNHVNLERVADYCENNYLQAENKRIALEETKNFTTQSLASVAYQVNALACNFLQLLELQSAQLNDMESQTNHISQTVSIHKEKVARREIGVLTSNKNVTRQYKIIAPANPEKPIKYVRKPIDYSILDHIGHGVRDTTPHMRQRGISQSSVQSIVAAPVGPAPTTKPPTPPSIIRGTGTLSKSNRDYRTPPVVAPPQVPNHYAPNYPGGHRRERGAGYSTLPMGQPQYQHQAQYGASPQIGMVHPIPHQHAIPSQAPSVVDSMPPPPSPMTINTSVSSSSSFNDQNLSISSMGTIYRGGLHHGMTPSQYQQHSMTIQRQGSCSPPLPPPPSAIEEEHARFGRPQGQNSSAIVPEEPDLPGWVPKNYIEKVVAIYDYYADKDDELSFQENSVIYVLKKNDDGWWEGVMEGLTGLFPGNYVEPCM